MRALALLLAALLLAPLALAQTAPPVQRWSIGGQLGVPSGVTTKYFTQTDRAYELFAGWEFGDELELYGFLHYERPITGAPLRFSYGPGVSVIVREDDTAVGVAGTFGVTYVSAPFEAFFRLVPRLDVLPDTRGDVGAGFGLRYYFGAATR